MAMRIITLGVGGLQRTPLNRDGPSRTAGGGANTLWLPLWWSGDEWPIDRRNRRRTAVAAIYLADSSGRPTKSLRLLPTRDLRQALGDRWETGAPDWQGRGSRAAVDVDAGRLPY